MISFFPWRAAILVAAFGLVAACHRYERRPVSSECPRTDPAPGAAVVRRAAPEAPLAVVGTVVADTAAGDPIAGAEVRLAGPDRVARTDSLGTFRLDAPAPGTYAVVARQLGFRPGQDSAVVTARAGQALRLVLAHPPLDGCGLDMYLLVRKPWWKWW